MHGFLQPSSEYEKFKLHPKTLESMKIQLSGLCPLSPLRASWAGPSSPPLWLMHPPQCTKFSECPSIRSLLQSGHQSHEVPPLSSWLFCSLGFLPAVVTIWNSSTTWLYFLAFSHMCNQALVLISLCWQFLVGFCSPDWIPIQRETKRMWGF